jgi:hypothetical protein
MNVDENGSSTYKVKLLKELQNVLLLFIRKNYMKDQTTQK